MGLAKKFLLHVKQDRFEDDSRYGILLWFCVSTRIHCYVDANEFLFGEPITITRPFKYIEYFTSKN